MLCHPGSLKRCPLCFINVAKATGPGGQPHIHPRSSDVPPRTARVVRQTHELPSSLPQLVSSLLTLSAHTAPIHTAYTSSGNLASFPHKISGCERGLSSVPGGQRPQELHKRRPLVFPYGGKRNYLLLLLHCLLGKGMNKYKIKHLNSRAERATALKTLFLIGIAYDIKCAFVDVRALSKRSHSSWLKQKARIFL